LKCSATIHEYPVYSPESKYVYILISQNSPSINVLDVPNVNNLSQTGQKHVHLRRTRDTGNKGVLYYYKQSKRKKKSYGLDNPVQIDPRHGKKKTKCNVQLHTTNGLTL